MSSYARVQLRGFGKGAIDHFIRQAVSGGGGGMGLSVINARFSARASVGAGGTRFLETLRGIPTSNTGEIFTDEVRLKGISIKVNNADATRSFRVEVFRDSSSPVVIATLDLPVNNDRAFRRDLDIVIPAGTEVGARVVRASGSGASSFNRINCNVELQLS